MVLSMDLAYLRFALCISIDHKDDKAWLGESLPSLDVYKGMIDRLDVRDKACHQKESALWSKLQV